MPRLPRPTPADSNMELNVNEIDKQSQPDYEDNFDDNEVYLCNEKKKKLVNVNVRIISNTRTLEITGKNSFNSNNGPKLLHEIPISRDLLWVGLGDSVSQDVILGKAKGLLDGLVVAKLISSSHGKEENDGVSVIHLIVIARRKRWFLPFAKDGNGITRITLICRSGNALKPHWLNELYQAQLCPGFKRLSANQSILIIANPFSGNGKAKKVLRKVEEILRQCPYLCYEVYVTTRKDDALEMVRDRLKEEDDQDQDKYSCILSIGGDGIIHEIVNGYMQRVNSKSTNFPSTSPSNSPSTSPSNSNFAFGFLSGGTSNALCSSLHGSFRPIVEELLIALQGNIRYMDLLNVVQECSIEGNDDSESHDKIQIPSAISIYSHMGVMWGIISDTDFMSDRYRWMGNDLKKIYSFLWMLFRLKIYRGVILDKSNVTLGNGSEKSGVLLNSSLTTKNVQDDVIDCDACPLVNVFILNAPRIANDVLNDSETSLFDANLTVQLTQYDAKTFKRWDLIKMLLDPKSSLSSAPANRTIRDLQKIVIEPNLEDKKKFEEQEQEQERGKGKSFNHHISIATNEFSLNIDGERLPLYDRTIISVVPSAIPIFTSSQQQ